MAKRDRPYGLDILDVGDRHFEGINDFTLLILKAHLLIEEELYNQLRSVFPNPQYFDQLSLNFHRLILLGRALNTRRTDENEPVEHVEMCWDAIEALNTIRNKLAHNLEPPDLDPLLARMRLVLREAPRRDDLDIIASLNVAIGFLLQFVASLTGVHALGLRI
jgi:hypothetical protein